VKILLDECIDVKLRLIVAEYGHDVQTVSFAGYKGLKNGKLLDAAEGNFDVLVTIDKSIANQTNFRQRKISLLVIRTASSDLGDILLHIPDAMDALRRIAPGQIIYAGLGVI
jgi:predicted nuclease of predicted toxin-antitoxin system